MVHKETTCFARTPFQRYRQANFIVWPLLVEMVAVMEMVILVVVDIEMQMLLATKNTCLLKMTGRRPTITMKRMIAQFVVVVPCLSAVGAGALLVIPISSREVLLSLAGAVRAVAFIFVSTLVSGTIASVVGFVIRIVRQRLVTNKFGVVLKRELA